MRSYEGMFIIKPDMVKEEFDKTLEAMTAAITKNGGKVDNCQKWGRRRLAYIINKYIEGEYYLCDFTTEPQSIRELDAAYRLNENILRVLITVKPPGKAAA